MTMFDLVILGIIFFSAIIGSVRGLVDEAFSLLAIALSFFGAVQWGDSLEPLFERYIDEPMIIVWLSYIGVFLGIFLVLGLISKMLSSLIKATGLGFANRSLGFVFGLVRGVLIVLVLFVIAGYSNFVQEQWWQESQLAPLLIQLIVQIKAYLPSDIGSYLPY